MKLLRELLIILVIYFVGEILTEFFNLPVPGNIMGMILLVILLCTNVVKLEMVDTVANFLLDHLAFFFIPAGVGILTSLVVIKDSFIRLLIVCFISTIVTIAVTALIVEFMTKEKKGAKKQKEVC
ncbi:CidA/LrgA family protein [Clostridium sp.]|uniref:CidA/LrgA family protein n=1 Tax=Clostridium sp. TaxID=1506 RepID=UPI001A3BF00A|nr:CidA/LrgA family protein [Clostridium sp.]MBK5239943.1 CidA/LrgA family protein [Clostridium sp.]